MTKILGLDLGTSSVAHGIIDFQKKEIIAAGSRVFQAGVDGLGIEEKSWNAERRKFRQVRKQYFRRRLTKRKLIKILVKKKLFPEIDTSTIKSIDKELQAVVLSDQLLAFFKLNPYALRSKAIDKDQKLTPFELGRIFYHLAQRKGFRGSLQSSTAEEEGKIYDGDIKKGLIGIDDTKSLINRKNTTLGDALNDLYPKSNLAYKFTHQRIRGRYTHRNMYMDEFHKIWEVQSNQEPLMSILVSDPDFKKLIGPPENANEEGGILFHQRKLKPQIRGRCILEPTAFRAFDSEPLVELKRMWEFINTIEYEEGRLVDNKEINVNKITDLFNTVHDTVKFPFSEIKKAIGMETLGFNYDDDKKIPYNRTCAQLRGIFGKDIWDKMPDDWDQSMGKKPEGIGFTKQDVWHLLKFAPDDAGSFELFLRKKETLDKLNLKEFSVKGKKQVDNVKLLLKTKMSKSVASLSRKAIKNILPYLRDHNLVYNQAVLLGGVRNALGFGLNDSRDIWKTLNQEEVEKIERELISLIQNKESNKKPIEQIGNYLKEKFKITGESIGKLYHHSDINQFHDGLLRKYLPQVPRNINNPVVVQTLSELRKVVNKLIDEHGPFDVIRVELARELKSTKGQREELTEKNRANEELNDTARKWLRERQYPESTGWNGNIIKWKLWEETKHRCPYTGDQICSTDLFINGKYDVEHIIPEYLSHDNSFPNLTLCRGDKNIEKGKRTSFEAFGTTDQWMAIEIHSKYLPYLKRKRFLSEDTPTSETMTTRMLNDTRYISKVAKEYLKNICEKVTVVQGSTTDILRHHWGFNSILKPSISVELEEGEYLVVASGSKILAYEKFDYATFRKRSESLEKEFKERLKAAKKKKPEENTDEENGQLEPFTVLRGIVKNNVFHPGKSRDDHRHHAIDAIVVALADPVYLQAISTLSRRGVPKKELKDTEEYKASIPWPRLRKDAEGIISDTLVSHKRSHAYNDEPRITQQADGKIVKTYERIVDGKRKKAVKTYLIGGVKAREKLHEATYYGKYLHYSLPDGTKKNKQWFANWDKHPDMIGKNVVECFHVRVKLEEITQKKHVEEIVDENIKEAIKKRLREIGIDTQAKNYDIPFSKSLKGITTKVQLHEYLNNNEELIIAAEKFIVQNCKTEISGDYKFRIDRAFPTNVFFEYDDERKISIPKVFLKNTNGGDDVPIKKVRTIKPMNNALKLKEATNTWVDPKNNHAVILYKTEDGEQKGTIIQYLEAVESQKKGWEIIDKSRLNGSYVLTLRKGDMVLKGFSMEDFNIEQLPPLNEISDCLYKIRKFTINETGIQISAIHHLASIPNIDKALPPIVWRFSPSTFKGIKVKITETGKLELCKQ